SILTDHLGSPIAMLDAQANLAWSAHIGTWGQLRRHSGGQADCPFRWPGQYEDAETGLYYNRFRYYDPEAGQYASQDPIGLAGGLALHAYVPDPTLESDPLGLETPKPPAPYSMRTQLQRGNDHLASVAIDSTEPITAVQVEKAMMETIEKLPEGEKKLIRPG